MMIRCPDCGGTQVREERHIPLPTRGLPFLRYVGKAWKVIMVVLGLLGTFAVLRFILWGMEQLPEEGPSSMCFVAIAGPVLLLLLPYAIGKGMSFIVSALVGFHDWASGPADELPRLYWRICASCGFEWTWKPGQPQRRVRARRVSVQRRGQKPKAGRGRRRPLDKQDRRHLHWVKAHAYQPFLEELIAHWNGTYEPGAGFSLHTPVNAVAFFRDYQRALGESPEMKAGHRVTGFIRNYYPSREEILIAMRAYQHLRRGDRAVAARGFQGLVRSHPQFVEPWIWLSATAGTPGERRECLGRATQLEPAHPLALDAWAIAQGVVSPAEARRDVRESEVVIVRCPKCGGSLLYEPGVQEVVCRYCSYRIGLPEDDQSGLDLDKAPLVTTLRLQRRIEGNTWKDVSRALRCRACGAELGGGHHLARQCAYCGSTNVLVEDDPRTIQQPDGLLLFTLDERQAADAIREVLRVDSGRFKRRWLDKKPMEIRSLQGVYVPFWVFDGAVEVRWVQWYGSEAPTSERERLIRHHDLLLPGVDVPPPSLLDQVLPFRLRELVPYEARLLADWPAQLYTLDVEVVVEDAYDTMLLLSRRRAGAPVKAQKSKDEPIPSETQRTFQVSGVTYQLVLLPVWVALLGSQGESSLALVNGQTGEVVTGLALSGGS